MTVTACPRPASATAIPSATATLPPPSQVTKASSEICERVVERLARAHRRVDLLGIGPVVAADLEGRSLYVVELADDRLLLVGELGGQRLEALAQLGVGQLLRPVEREVEVAAPVVELADLAPRRAVVLQPTPDRP